MPKWDFTEWSNKFLTSKNPWTAFLWIMTEAFFRMRLMTGDPDYTDVPDRFDYWEHGMNETWNMWFRL